MKVLFVAGGRPNFMKIAPVWHAMEKYKDIKKILVHTGQHYDVEMSDVFFRDLNLPHPNVNLGVGSGPHGKQTGLILAGLEKVIQKEKPDVVLVFGDMNSTLAGALASVKLGIPVAHVQAGWRSHDSRMPEEINRSIVDRIADIHFPETYEDCLNLYHEGIPSERVFMVGNVMIDSLLSHLKLAEKTSKVLAELNLKKNGYMIVTAHRPENVDNVDGLTNIVDALCKISKNITVVYPIHPRTKKRLKRFNLLDKLKNCKNIRAIKPVGYIDFLKLLYNSRFALTDSGAVQEEGITLGIPCLTMRQNTELYKSIERGTNILVGVDSKNIEEYAMRLLNDKKFYQKIKRRKTPYPYWDGTAGEQIAKIVYNLWKNKNLKEKPSNFIENGYPVYLMMENMRTVMYKSIKKALPPNIKIVEVFDTNGNMVVLDSNTKIEKGYKIKFFGGKDLMKNLSHIM